MNRSIPLIGLSLLFATAAVAQNKADFVFTPETVEKSGPPSKTLQKALKLYENKDYYSASIELHKVIEETGDSEANKQRAEFWMGKTLYHLNFYSASMSYFDRITQKEGHRYYNATLKWLASLSRQLPESAGILKKIGKYDRAQLEQPALADVRDELFYLLGRYHYTVGNFKDAVSLFGAVGPSSEFYARAKFMEGITHVRNYQGRPAAAAFKELLRKAQEDPDIAEIERFEELAILSLARVFYSTGQFQLSVKYYDQLPQYSEYWLDALFESGWSYFQINNFSKALGNIHTLNAPFFEGQFFPESLILKAVIYHEHCLFDLSTEAISEFNNKYPPLKTQLEAILRQYKDATEFYDYAKKIKEGIAGLSKDVGRMAQNALSDRTIEKYFTYVDELDRELKQVQNADPAWKATAIAGVVLQDLTLQKSLAMNETGQLAQRRLKRASEEIQELVKQAIKVEYENTTKAITAMQAKQSGGPVAPPPKNEMFLQPDDEHYYWPFNGEYWRDELGYYRFRIINKCPR